MNENLAFLTGTDGAEARGDLTAADIADAITNVAERSADRRLALHHTQFGALDQTDKAELVALLGSATAHERILLGRAIRVLMGVSE